MDTDYDNMMIIELRALARAYGLRGYTRLRRAGLITFLWDNATPARLVSVNPRPSNMCYDALRMVELTGLVREHGLWGYSMLRRAGLITLLWENEPMPELSVGVNFRARTSPDL